MITIFKKDPTWVELCGRARDIMRRETPRPLISRTIDAFKTLKPHEREELLHSELFTHRKILK